MKKVFLSYSSSDYFFAEMLAIKLDEAGYQIWRDQGSIRAGDDWRQTIEEGIKDSLAVIIALSSNSADSPYVTFEWAYALGMGKSVIPVKLSQCTIHPRLEPTQYIDFSYPRALPWESLLQRLKEVEVESEPSSEKTAVTTTKHTEEIDLAAGEVLGYLNSHGYTMASQERLKQKLGKHITQDMLEAVIDTHPSVFRRATIKGGKPGIAKRIP